MICVYPADCTDFSTNGAGTLSPESCELRWTLNGEYEVTLVHPIDEMGKWTRLETGVILRVPVPEDSVTPAVELPDNCYAMDVTSRGKWRFTSASPVYDRPGSIRKRCVLATYRGGDYCAIRGTIYFVIYKDKTSGTLLSYEEVSSYPSGAAPEGQTRTVETWYKVLAYKWDPEEKVSKAVDGWVRSGTVSNVYHSTEYVTVVGDTVEAKPLREQPFRVYRVVPELDKVTVYARHLFYDLLDNMILSYKKGEHDRGAEIVKGLGGATEYETQFKFFSDITETPEEFEVDQKNPVEAIMGEDGVIGKCGGELFVDWYDAYVVKRLGHDTDILIAEGKNLLGITYDVDVTNVTTRILPIGENAKGKRLYLPEKYVDSTHINDYASPKILTLTVSDAKVGKKLTQGKAYQMMRDAAQAEFDRGCDLPTVTLDVEFVNEFDTEEYKPYAFLKNIYPGDAVRVRSRRVGVDVSMRMTQYVYDCLQLRYQSMTLGTAADTVASSMITSRQLPTGIISGSKLAVGAVGTGNIADGAVKTAQIDNAAIESANIANGAIENAHIANGTIENAKIKDGTIESAKIKDGTIESAKIKDGSIENAKIKDGSIESAKIKDGTIETAKIKNGAIDSAKIADLAVTTAKIAAAAITNALIANAAIDTAKIALGAITSALIAQGAIGTVQIADGSITDAKIVSLNADVIKSGTLSTERLIITGADGLIYEINASSGGLTAQKLSEEQYRQQLSGTVLVARSVTAEQIAAATITANEILSGTITGDKIAADTIEGRSIKAGEITASHVAANFGEQLDLSSNAGINLRVQAVSDKADETADSVQALTQSVSGLSTQLNVFSDGISATVEGHSEILSCMSFDAKGLRIQMANSIYYTLTDGVGYHIFQNDREIANFSEGRGRMDELQIGKITCRRTSKGGWVWTEVNG